MKLAPLASLLFALGGVLLPVSVLADEELPIQLAALSPEQRELMRQQMREHWQQQGAGQEQRREQRKEWRERVQNSPPEERQRMREERLQRRDGAGEREGRQRRFWLQ